MPCALHVLSICSKCACNGPCNNGYYSTIPELITKRSLRICIDCSLLGCAEGRSAAGWVDYNLFGHQIVCHRIKGYNGSATANAVDGDPVPVPHFGLALSVQQFHDLADRLKQAKVDFVIQPHLRFKGRRIVQLLQSLAG